MKQLKVVKELKTQTELSQKEVQNLRYVIQRSQEADALSQMYVDFAAYARNTLTQVAREYGQKYGLPEAVDYDLTPEGILKVKEAPSEPA